MSKKTKSAGLEKNGEAADRVAGGENLEQIVLLSQKGAELWGAGECARRLGVKPAELTKARSGKRSAVSLEMLQKVVMPLDRTKYPDSGAHKFVFVDLFAGIGGLRMAAEKNGGMCAFTSEWNVAAQRTYLTNYQDGHGVNGDITKIEAASVPDHDLLLAGFPCQPFSIAGVSKKISLGRSHGFEDKTQGTLFFDVARIIKEKRPKAFLLENVKNLASHDKGRTFQIILETLRDELGYDVHWKICDAKEFVPQHRERILIAGFAKPTGFDFKTMRKPALPPSLADILHKTDGTEADDGRCLIGGKIPDKYVLSDKLWDYLQRYAQKHKESGNGFGYGLAYPDGIARTLSARYYKDGSEILVWRGDGLNPRRLTPRECARLMGFPDDFAMSESDAQAYKQFGNSVAVPLFASAIEAMSKVW